jgi:hypothetical protein
MPNWKKVIVSGSSAALTSVIATAGFTGSLSGSALTATSASYALTASNITPVISNDVDTRVITANGNGTLNGEGNLTFNGQTLSVLYGVGDEGGEMLLGKPATNTTLTGSGVTVDVFQNRLRFFEQGGTARGFYLDITTGGSGASTNLASGGGTVTSVGTTGTVNGITLTGGPITGTGTITLGGTLSGITPSQLATSSIMIGSTNITLGATASSLTGLTSINATSFTGSLRGTASNAVDSQTAINASQADTISITNTTTGTGPYYPLFVDTTAGFALARVDNSGLSYNATTNLLSTTASYANQALSSSFATTTSFAQNAQTASFVTGSNVYGPFGSNSVTSASFAATASFSQATTENRILVLNQSGNTIAKGIVVHITASGNSSDTPRVITASYENDNYSANTLGIASEAITNGSTGYVTTEGVLTGINTSAFTSGQLVYLGAAGSITGSAPLAPLHSVRLGQVVRDQSVNGSIYVRVDNGYELGELHDVRDFTTTSSYGDLLVKSGSVWINSKQLTGSYGVTGSLVVLDNPLTGSLNTSTRILTDTSNIPSILWGGRTLAHPLGSFTVDWGNQFLRGDDNFLSIDWKGRRAYDANATQSIDWRTRELWDGDPNGSGSNVKSLNWSNRTIFDSATTESINWEDRNAIDKSAIPSINWQDRGLFDPSNNTVLDWKNRFLYTPGGEYSLIWNNDAYLGSNIYQRDSKSTSLQGAVSSGTPTDDTYLGDIIEGKINGSNPPTDGELCYLAADGKWYTYDQTTSSIYGKMLGIAFKIDPGSETCQVLLEGHLLVTDSSNPSIQSPAPGRPVYIKDGTTAGEMSTNIPTTGIVQVLGHCYYNNTSTTSNWMMKFRPSMDWYQI